MSSKDGRTITALMRSARAKARGYADFFGWATDRTLEEWGVTNALRESLERSSEAFFYDLKSRERGADPPDCEAVDNEGRRIAIEVTELVSEKAIRATKRGMNVWANWSEEHFIASLAARIKEKGDRYVTLKDGPYEGGYIILVHTDEPMLSTDIVRAFLDGRAFHRPEGVTRAFILLSYDPRLQTCPYFELALRSSP